MSNLKNKLLQIETHRESGDFVIIDLGKALYSSMHGGINGGCGNNSCNHTKNAGCTNKSCGTANINAICNANGGCGDINPAC
jgi:hypothetical protein